MSKLNDILKNTFSSKQKRRNWKLILNPSETM